MPGIGCFRALKSATIAAAMSAIGASSFRFLKASCSTFAICSEPPANTLPTPHKPGSDRGLQRFGCREIDQPRRHRLRRHAVLDQRDQQRVEYFGFLRGRQAAPDLQERHRTEIDLAEQVVGQVEAAHGDAVARAPAHAGFQLLSLFGHRPPRKICRASAVRSTSVGPSVIMKLR